MNFLSEYDDFFKMDNMGFLIKNTGVGEYDFNFRNSFSANSIVSEADIPIVLRIGAISDFDKVKQTVEETGNRLLYTRENQLNASDFERWYPLIKSHTPRSKIYDEFPDLSDVMKDFKFPFFMKGNRQTSRHQRKLSIISNEKMFNEAGKIWQFDSILHWQKAVVREYVPLETIDDTSFPDMIPMSREFRVFVWKKHVVSIGKYWTMGEDYHAKDGFEEHLLRSRAEKIAQIIDTPFLAVDIAKTSAGDYIVIEINDGQESGYAGNDSYVLWRNIFAVENSMRKEKEKPMNKNHEKYLPFKPVDLETREWPGKVIKHAPIWCSVDLRDGNQALVTPMNLEEKLNFFATLVNIGFKEIEVGFPSASETEYEILRALIDRKLIPDDVTVQVLVQAREHLIRKTFEAIEGAKNVIVHFYNSTSALQRKVVFKKDMNGITEIAVNGAKLIKELSKESSCNIRYEYSPESFSGTEPDFAVSVCRAVMDALEIDGRNKIILNLPATVEMSTPNTYADQIEYFIKHLPNRQNAIISLHPHNDRGTGAAAAELGLLAGADRIEGTLFGNGERTGNVDIVTMALNMHTQAIDPKLDFSRLSDIRRVYESATKMQVHERHPYAGELVFTAFSGSHQDAINKGVDYMKQSKSPYWEIPYLPIDPADVGRQYEPIIRINSQSGKGGAAFVMQSVFGYDLPKAMHPEFGAIVKRECDCTGRELEADGIMGLFRREYLDIEAPYKLIKHRVSEESEIGGASFDGILLNGQTEIKISGSGNGPIDAFFRAIERAGISGYEFIFYHEHAVSGGSDSLAAAYIQLKTPDGKDVFGAATDPNIIGASLKAVLCAINRNI